MWRYLFAVETIVVATTKYFTQNIRQYQIYILK